MIVNFIVFFNVLLFWFPADQGLKKVGFSTFFKVVRDTCQKITLLLLKSKSVRVIVPESCC